MRHAPILLTAACFVSSVSALAQSAGNAVDAVTYIDISSDWVVQGKDLLRQYRDRSQEEVGNIEFTVLEEINRPNRFVIVEGWRDETAFALHTKGANASVFNFTLGAICNSPLDTHVLQAFATAPRRHDISSGALYLVEHIDFQGGDPAISKAAEPLVKALATSSQKESGVARYDIFQQPAPRTNHYQVVAAWANSEAFDAHESAPYTREFRFATTFPTIPARVNLYDQRIYKALE